MSSHLAAEGNKCRNVLLVQGILLGSLDNLAWQIRLREAQGLGRLPAFMRREKHPSGGKHGRKKPSDAAPEEREEKPSTVGSTSVIASLPEETSGTVGVLTGEVDLQQCPPYLRDRCRLACQ